MQALTAGPVIALSHDFLLLFVSGFVSASEVAFFSLTPGDLNEIGEEIGKEYGISYLPSDFKKKNGYKRSVELSAQYGLYRQDYCGCVYSKRSS